MNHRLPLLALFLLVLAGCEEDDPRDIFEVVYEVRFETAWSETTFPGAYPPDAHFSPLVGMSHRPNVFVFETGLPASDGLRIVAETGATGEMEDELQRAVNQGLGLDLFTGPEVDAPGSGTVLVGVGERFPSVTILSMIAPSPDWFVAARATLLTPDAQWYDEVTVFLDSYDAGTDSGTGFTSPDQATDPANSVKPITDGPLVAPGDSVVRDLGRVVFTRVQ